MGKYREEISSETFEQIEKYLLDGMDAQTKLQFEKQMDADELLASEVKLQRQLLAAIETGSFFASDHELTPLNNKRDFTGWYAAAAVFLLVGAASFWFFIKNDTLDSGDLFAEYFHPDPGLLVAMGAADSSSYQFYDGMIDYKQGNFDLALNKWNRLMKVGVQTDTLQYYIGMAHLNKGNANESIRFLSRLITKPEGAFFEEANWYLALAYLKDGDITRASSILKKIRGYPGADPLINKLHRNQN